MKTKISLAVIFMAALTVIGYGQSVMITSKMVTYTRPKPISEYKKTFTINYPKVKAATPALSKQIESSISYQKILGLDVKDELRDSQWLEEADYEVGYNGNGILSIRLWIDGSGAYPSGTSKIVVVDLKTGLSVKAANVFINLAGLTAIVRKAQKKEIADAIREIKKDPDNADVDPESLFKESAQYHRLTLDEFSVDDKGVTFHHDYDFAHVVQALQPAGEYFFTWAQLKPYIKAGGLLSRMAR